MKKLPWKREHLEARFNSTTCLEINQLVLLKIFQKANSNFSAYQFHFANGQAYCQANQAH